MTRILLVPFGSPGHTTPFRALGAALARRGHDVLLYGTDGTITPTRWRPAGPVPAELVAAADAAALFRFMFFGSVLDMTHDVLDATRRHDVDLVVGDVFMPGAGLAAELAGLPWVSVSTTAVPAADSYRSYLDPHAAANFDATTTRAALGLPPAPGENLLGRLSPMLHLIPTTPAFAGPVDLPASAALVGPFVRTARIRTAKTSTVAVTATTNSATVLAGRTFARDRYLATTVRALADLPIRAVLTASYAGGLPPNVERRGPAPHDDLFDTVDAVVCHAGWGTVGRALMRGLPLVLVPMVGDQFYIAGRCAELGVGIRLDADTMSTVDIRDAIHAVHTDDRYRGAAAAIAAEFHATAPLDTAPATVESVLGLERVSTL